MMCFIGTCFAKKIFDEVHERMLKRPVGAQLDKLFKKIEVPTGKTIEYRDVIYFEVIYLTVVIRAIATERATKNLQFQVMQCNRTVSRTVYAFYKMQLAVHKTRQG